MPLSVPSQRLYLGLTKDANTCAEANVAKHLADLGIEEEFGNHAHMRGLSGGQKVKVVLAAATWMSPHIIVLVTSSSSDPTPQKFEQRAQHGLCIARA